MNAPFDDHESFEDLAAVKEFSDIPPYEGDLEEDINQLLENFDWDAFAYGDDAAEAVEEIVDWISDNMNIADDKAMANIAWEAVNHLVVNNFFPEKIEDFIEEILEGLDAKIESAKSK